MKLFEKVKKMGKRCKAVVMASAVAVSSALVSVCASAATTEARKPDTLKSTWEPTFLTRFFYTTTPPRFGWLALRTHRRFIILMIALPPTGAHIFRYTTTRVKSTFQAGIST